VKQTQGDLLGEEIGGLEAIPTHDSKATRLEAVVPTIESGQVYLPGVAREDGYYDRLPTPAWVVELVDEVAAFAGPYDDQVDALTQALIWLRHHPRGPRVRFPGFS
jgi:predicted phage terminase large subunit-like protein